MKRSTSNNNSNTEIKLISHFTYHKAGFIAYKQNGDWKMDFVLFKVA